MKNLPYLKERYKRDLKILFGVIACHFGALPWTEYDNISEPTHSFYWYYLQSSQHGQTKTTLWLKPIFSPLALPITMKGTRVGFQGCPQMCPSWKPKIHFFFKVRISSWILQIALHLIDTCSIISLWGRGKKQQRENTLYSYKSFKMTQFSSCTDTWLRHSSCCHILNLRFMRHRLNETLPLIIYSFELRKFSLASLQDFKLT